MSSMQRTTTPKILIILAAGLLLMGTAVSQSFAQDKLPVREHTNPDKMISLGKDMSFSQAIDILNTFSQKYDNKFILNRSSAKGAIGVTLPLMYWYDALKYITEAKGIVIVPHDKYYELRDAPTENNSVQATTSANGDKGPEIDTRTREVRISATFFDGSRNAFQELGIDWSTFKDGVVQIGGTGATNMTNDYFSVQTLKPIEIGSGISVEGLFKAFESKNLGQILARPTIKVMDGMEGHIQVGQDFSINQRDFAGNVVTKFFSVGTILTVTPHIITEHDTTFIYMKLHVERSTAQPDPVSTIVNKQSADSDIMLLSGESTVIAGLYQTEVNKIRKGVPILKDLPAWFFGLRYLFGYNSKEYKERELVILIKASIDPGLKQRMKEEKKSTQEILDHEREKMRKENKIVKKKTGF